MACMDTWYTVIVEKRNAYIETLIGQHDSEQLNSHVIRPVCHNYENTLGGGGGGGGGEH